MKGSELMGMMGKPMPMKKAEGDSSIADDAAKEFIANPSAATFKALMTLCEESGEEPGAYDEQE